MRNYRLIREVEADEYCSEEMERAMRAEFDELSIEAHLKEVKLQVKYIRRLIPKGQKAQANRELSLCALHLMDIIRDGHYGDERYSDILHATFGKWYPGYYADEKFPSVEVGNIF